MNFKKIFKNFKKKLKRLRRRGSWKAFLKKKGNLIDEKIDQKIDETLDRNDIFNEMDNIVDEIKDNISSENILKLTDAFYQELYKREKRSFITNIYKLLSTILLSIKRIVERGFLNVLLFILIISPITYYGYKYHESTINTIERINSEKKKELDTTIDNQKSKIEYLNQNYNPNEAPWYILTGRGTRELVSKYGLPAGSFLIITQGRVMWMKKYSIAPKVKEIETQKATIKQKEDIIKKQKNEMIELNTEIVNLTEKLNFQTPNVSSDNLVRSIKIDVSPIDIEEEALISQFHSNIENFKIVKVRDTTSVEKKTTVEKLKEFDRKLGQKMSQLLSTIPIKCKVRVTLTEVYSNVPPIDSGGKTTLMQDDFNDGSETSQKAEEETTKKLHKAEVAYGTKIRTPFGSKIYPLKIDDLPEAKKTASLASQGFQGPLGVATAILPEIVEIDTDGKITVLSEEDMDDIIKKNKPTTADKE